MSTTERNLSCRQNIATVGRLGLMGSLVFALVALVVLFATILNQTGGYTVVQNSLDPATLTDKPLDQLSDVALARILNDNLTAGQIDRYISATLATRSREQIDQVIAKTLAAPSLAALAGKLEAHLSGDDLAGLLSSNLDQVRFDAIRAKNAPALDQLDQAQLIEVAERTIFQATSEQQLSAQPLEGLTTDELVQVINDNFGPRRIDGLSNPDWAQLPPDALIWLIRNELLPAPDSIKLAGKALTELSQEELLQLLNEALGLKQLEQLNAGTLNQIPRDKLLAIARAELSKPIDPATLTDEPLNGLPASVLITLFRSKLPPGVFNHFTALALSSDETSANDAAGRAYLMRLIADDILQPGVKESWGLFQSLFDRASIDQVIAQKYPGSQAEFRWWLSRDFLTSVMSSRAELSGIRTALLGSLWMILITIVIAVPLGIGAAIYLEEFAGKSTFSQVIQLNIYNLAGVPSIIYGMLGLVIFVRALERLTSGAAFGVVDSNGRTVLSAALTMALLILPLIIINTQEAIRAVPSLLREAAYGIGLTKLETIWHHVLPAALPGILTGTILAMSRAIGETAPLIVIGASTFIAVDPSGPFSKFTVLPIQIYKWTSLPDQTFRNIAAAAIVVLLTLLILLNLTAIFLRNRFRQEN